MRYSQAIRAGSSPTHNINDPGKQISSSISSIGINAAFVLWFLREYVNNDGASHDPQLTDFDTASVTNYILSANIIDDKGIFFDALYEQYHHKCYEIELFVDQATELGITLDWYGQVTIVAEHDSVQTEVYSTGTDTNKVSRFNISLSAGITRLYILTYTNETTDRFGCCIDTIAIGGARAPLEI